METKYTMGIDISKNHLDYALLRSGYELIQAKQIRNTDSSIERTLNQLTKDLSINLSEVFICCENTGIYNRPLERTCSKLTAKLWVEHPLKIKYTTTKLRGKTDKEDALRIAEYGIRYRDKAVLYKEPSIIIQQLKEYLKARDTLLENQVSLKNQLKEARSHDTMQYKILKDSYKSALTGMTKSLKALEEKIKELSKLDPEISKNLELITSIPGLGIQNALQMIIYTENFQKFTNPKQFACYAGVVPFENQSGTIQKPARVSRMANKKLKKLLHLGAMCAIRHNPELKLYYIRKVSEGKNKMSVINAVRNKLIHRVYAVIQRQEPYKQHVEASTN